MVSSPCVNRYVTSAEMGTWAASGGGANGPHSYADRSVPLAEPEDATRPVPGAHTTVAVPVSRRSLNRPSGHSSRLRPDHNPEKRTPGHCSKSEKAARSALVYSASKV